MNQLSSIWINKTNRVIPAVRIQIPPLRVEDSFSSRNHRIHAQEPVQGMVIVPRAEVIEAGLGVPLLAGEFQSRVIRACPRLLNPPPRVMRSRVNHGPRIIRYDPRRADLVGGVVEVGVLLGPVLGDKLPAHVDVIPHTDAETIILGNEPPIKSINVVSARGMTESTHLSPGPV